MLGSWLEKSRRPLIVLTIIGSTGCAYHAPTIAHIHLGHTVTGVEGTPGDVGFLTVAQKSAEQALDRAEQALADGQSLVAIKEHIAAVNRITNTDEDVAVTKALDHAMAHIRFAAETDDSSENVRNSSPELQTLTEGIFYRSNLITLYAQDLVAIDSQEDGRVVAEQVQQLTHANLNGEDSDDDGKIGDKPAEMGMVQLRAEVDAMIAREDPPYVTVDRWYLFNLIRLPDGQWIFRRPGSSAARGY